MLLAIYYHNNGKNEEGTGGDCNARSLMKNKYNILVGNYGRAMLIGSNRCTLENSANPVKPLRIYWEILDKITNCLFSKISLPHAENTGTASCTYLVFKVTNFIEYKPR